MKYSLCYILLFFLIACKSNNLNKTAIQSPEKQIFILENGPEISRGNSQCSLEIIPNTTLIIKQDEFQNAYIEIEKGEKTIIKYELKKNELTNTADSQHTELIYFEIDNNCKSLSLSDEELQTVKMMYGRLCYCKGSSGYFKVTQGKLTYMNKDNEMSIKLNFKVGKIPQLITEINETIKLK